MSIVHLEKNDIREPAALGPDADWFQQYGGPAADAIQSFCKTHDIVDELKSAVRLAEKCFAPSTIRLEEDVNPEADDKKIVIAVTTHNKSRQDVLAAYGEYRQQLIGLLPRAKNTFIRLSFDIS